MGVDFYLLNIDRLKVFIKYVLLVFKKKNVYMNVECIGLKYVLVIYLWILKYLRCLFFLFGFYVKMYIFVNINI